LKSVEGSSFRGFESLALRQFDFDRLIGQEKTARMGITFRLEMPGCRSQRNQQAPTRKS